MSRAIKLTNLYTLLHDRKPYRLIRRWKSTPPDASGFKFKVFAARWAIPHRRGATQFSDLWNSGGNLCSYTSHSRKGDREQDMRSRARSDITGTEMGTTPVPGKFNESVQTPPPQNHSEEQPMVSSKLLTFPTVLTIGRVAATPLLVCAFYSSSWWAPAAATGIFIAAAITDWLDGYLARKMQVRTQFGAFLDPVADKLIVATTLILLCTRPFAGHTSWLMAVPAIAIIGREITMSAVREWAAAQDKKLLKAVAVNDIGKWKTATQMVALTILLAAQDGSLVGAGSLASAGIVLLYVSAWLSLWSLYIYISKIWRQLLL